MLSEARGLAVRLHTRPIAGFSLQLSEQRSEVSAAAT